MWRVWPQFKQTQIEQPAFLFWGHVWQLNSKKAEGKQPKPNIYSEEEICIYVFSTITSCLELTMANLHSQLFIHTKVQNCFYRKC